MLTLANFDTRTESGRRKAERNPRRPATLLPPGIAEALANLHGGPYRFRLGGGTTLAARWKHRDSFRSLPRR